MVYFEVRSVGAAGLSAGTTEVLPRRPTLAIVSASQDFDKGAATASFVVQSGRSSLWFPSSGAGRVLDEVDQGHSQTAPEG